MATKTSIEQNNTVAWTVIVLSVLILGVAWAALYMFSAPISGI